MWQFWCYPHSRESFSCMLLRKNNKFIGSPELQLWSVISALTGVRKCSFITLHKEFTYYCTKYQHLCFRNWKPRAWDREVGLKTAVPWSVSPHSEHGVLKPSHVRRDGKVATGHTAKRQAFRSHISVSWRGLVSTEMGVSWRKT